MRSNSYSKRRKPSIKRFTGEFKNIKFTKLTDGLRKPCYYKQFKYNFNTLLIPFVDENLLQLNFILFKYFSDLIFNNKSKIYLIYITTNI